MSALTLKQQLHTNWRRASQAFSNLSSNERRLITITGLVALFILISYPVEAINEHLEENKRLSILRQRDYEEIRENARKYRSLAARLDKLKTSFRESKLTFEQLTSQLDGTIKASTGGAKYDMIKSGDPKPLGDEFEAQKRSFTIRSLTLQQMVKLLYELENGKTPLFLGNVQINRLGNTGNFKATLEITTIGAKRST